MSVTPTPIPIDELPDDFGGYLFDFFKGIIGVFKAVPIPFTSVTAWDVFIGCILVSAIAVGIRLVYGKGGSTTHE